MHGTSAALEPDVSLSTGALLRKLDAAPPLLSSLPRAADLSTNPLHFPLPENTADTLLTRLKEVIDRKDLHPLFQPIVSLQSVEILGYEALIRGPSDSPLHSPLNLFKVARAHGLAVEVERLCCIVALQAFARLGLPGNIFLNISPECLLQPALGHGRTLEFVRDIGLNPERVIIELTESQPTYDYDLLREAVTHYRALGFRIAIDDLGEGFSSLRLWSELRPDYVKIDMHFVQGIQHDPVKLQFVRSIQEIAAESGTVVIAEGIENESELLLLRDLGIRCGQGYHIARPMADPMRSVSAAVAQALRRNGIAVYPQRTRHGNGACAGRLLRRVESVSPQHSNNQLYDMFQRDPELQIVPVLDNGLPLGLVDRHKLIDLFARPYLRELYGKKPCTAFMDAQPVVADRDTSLQDLSAMILSSKQQQLLNGFIITENGQYLGMGTSHDLMRELTQMQITAARYANPLTLLPGNVPIDEHIDRLLEGGAAFCACYVDLDHFKPYNDVHGYRRGDDVIQMTGRLLSSHMDQDRDFIGHIGGDDFILLIQSPDWERRCRAILDDFAGAIADHFDASDRDRSGYFSEDRRGNKTFFPLVSISLGVVNVAVGQYRSHHEIASAAAEAKRQSKKIPGNSIFVERRANAPA